MKSAEGGASLRSHEGLYLLASMASINHGTRSTSGHTSTPTPNRTILIKNNQNERFDFANLGTSSLETFFINHQYRLDQKDPQDRYDGVVAYARVLHAIGLDFGLRSRQAEEFSTYPEPGLGGKPRYKKELYQEAVRRARDVLQDIAAAKSTPTCCSPPMDAIDAGISSTVLLNCGVFQAYYWTTVNGTQAPSPTPHLGPGAPVRVFWAYDQTWNEEEFSVLMGLLERDFIGKDIELQVVQLMR